MCCNDQEEDSQEDSAAASQSYINTVVELTAASSLGNNQCEIRANIPGNIPGIHINTADLGISIFLRESCFSARTVAIEPEKETQSPKRNLVLLNQVSDTRQRPTQTNGNNLSRSESSSSDSINSQDGLAGRASRVGRSGSLGAWTGEGPPPVPSKPEMIKNINSKKRQDELELRHQELLARQRQLQVREERERMD